MLPHENEFQSHNDGKMATEDQDQDESSSPPDSPKSVTKQKTTRKEIENPNEVQEETPKEPSIIDIWKKKVEKFCESTAWMIFMGLLTIWTLYEGDIQLAATNQDADLAFELIISICFFIFSIEIFLQCFYKEDYFNIPSFHSDHGETCSEFLQNRLNIGSFYFWMDIASTFSLVFSMTWMLDSATNEALNGGGSQNAQGSSAAQVGAKVTRVVRLARMVRLVRIGKLYKYTNTILCSPLQAKQKKKKDNEEMESKVGAVMADLTNRRVIVLILLMIIVIPLLSLSDTDISLSLGVQLVHQLAVLNATDPATYQDGLLLAINITMTQLPVAGITFNGDQYFYYDANLINSLRDQEKIEYYYNSNGTSTDIIYDQKEISIKTAQYSIYTTSVVIVILLAGIYSFNADVESLVIRPIEKLVALVKKIADNPLGVEYSVNGEEDGFQEGMETTILLTTIYKIGGLMRVGFGEAGAGIIAKNLQASANGRLNLLGSGTMIYSIFGFCDVRQFTDTTECLQEEVMLFVNRIAHILHSIVVQCSGAANKNIGDAFLLTWKINERATKEQKALLADQALLTFCKAMIEIARHQEFICNFSVSASGRLFKRFPDYKVRIGSGLHVGWAIEGAIGSNRKIDATYISPHVSTSEFLESSTKEYGVSLLMSEPFYRLLSPAASRFVRQVDRIRRSAEEGPMGLYTYDCDLNIDWNDPFRQQRKKSTSAASAAGPRDARSRFQNAVRRATQMLGGSGGSGGQDLGLQTIKEVNSVSTNSRLGPGGPPSSSNSQSHLTSRAPSNNSHQLRNQLREIPLALRDRSRLGSVASSATDQTKGRGASRASVYGGARRASIVLQPMNFPGFTAIPLNETDEENPERAEAAAVEKLRVAKLPPNIILPTYSQQIWVEDQDLIDLRHRVSEEFRTIWSEGMDAFIIGDWTKAKEKFTETLRKTGRGTKDGPSKNLLNYINEEGGSSPDGWAGYRDLSKGGGGGH